ncbi:xanthine dehydrogenase family protein molybdopterin-binding subunit [Bradyrhizobium erythrophlei]|uniref:Xanthine dehydrogenase, molybdenum binding subunit apoprotein n=1 Tax=Bradyrhizobium erythrophlei TaxID=1437360 RepID=A0A1M5W5L1_9BRAD|nr:molybdopterin cofactor-binding domain-containing protein [Bradyrhizobium erythrophlei]SHH82812.1 xanthine dehydrogenase, molybdenum binding subunit apoprotein [Bradyrhizobium erythrophlei]
MAEAASHAFASHEPGSLWVGRSIPRVEDAALLTGRGRFIDDLGVRPGTLHAAILRSPHAHAGIVSIETSAAKRAAGVVAVLDGEDVKALTASLVVGVKAPVQCWPIAVERVRYVGEPVAIVVATDRYLAEDAVDLIEVQYRARPAVVDPLAALDADAPVLHDGFAGNVASDRTFRYGDPEQAFATAAHRISLDIRYPRNSCTPIETYGVVAEYDPGDDAYDVLANFQGPFSIHAVLSRALRVPGNRLRLRTPPDSGGSFGVKQGIFPYIVLVAAAARAAGRPVKWIEDRLEHLTASVSATNRATTLSAAVTDDGRILALDWDQVEDCGAHLRAPEPATLYRMHGNLTGAYDIRHLAVRNRVVVTNKTPTGLNRGFGGPQVYFALERLVHRIAVELGLDPLDVIRRNLVAADAFPYRTASGALLDSGNYQEAIRSGVNEGALEDLKSRRDAARAQGRLYGIGYTAVVEPSVSNMGYITTVLTPAERRKAGPKNGAQATATVAIDPVGTVTVHVASVPQGQGHRTVLSQVVADIFGLAPADIRVNTEMDTVKDAWSIASGNYASRFAPAVAGTAKLAAERIAQRLARIAASQLNTDVDDIGFTGGHVGSKRNPDNRVSFSRLAGLSHWAPGALPDGVGQTIRETVFWSPPELTAPDEEDHINSSLCHGFIFDFCGVEVDRTTLQTRIDRYVTMHDCGTILHPAMVDGQIRGGFAQAIGAALYEEYAYASDGSFLTGTFADYLVPTTAEVPDPLILHMQTPSPFTPLGSKGVGEGNCMSTPVCIANAVADALGLKDVELPLVPAKLALILRGAEPAPPAGRAAEGIEKRNGDRRLRGEGEATVGAPAERVWAMLLDPATLQAVIPGCHNVDKISDTHFRADVTLGIGPVKGRYRADVKLSDLDPPHAVTLGGSAEGALGFGGGEGRITLIPTENGGTTIRYVYEAAIGGKVASIGGRLLDGAARVIIGQFFAALARKAGGVGAGQSRISLLAKLRRLFGGRP